jgi:citrate lyase subunit beta/citryl-CoA lyase
MSPQPVPVLARSVLYVPGDVTDKLARAQDRGADALIIDLEDAVAPSAKETARHATADWLASRKDWTTPVWVRVNNNADLAADVAAVVGPGLAGLCLPKCAGTATLAHLDGLLLGSEVAKGVEPGSTRVWPLIESAEGLLAAAAMARASRVAGLQLGEVDLSAELGITPAEDEEELRPLRSTVVVASVAAGLGPPVAPVSPQWRDEDLYRRSTSALARMGFGGRACIHPRQVAIANEVFTPTPDQLEWAQGVLSRFDEALARGAGVLVDERGQLIDEAIVRIGRRILAVAALGPPAH